MVPYILMFIISGLLVWLGYGLRQRIIGKILICLGLILPCTMAGLRSQFVGTDTRGYIYNLYVLAGKSNSIPDFFQLAYKWYVQKDYLYLIISYIIGKNSLGFNLLLYIYVLLLLVVVL